MCRESSAWWRMWWPGPRGRESRGDWPCSCVDICSGAVAAVHGAGGVCGAGEAAADTEREAGSQGLPAPEEDAYAQEAYEAPQGSWRRCWRDVAGAVGGRAGGAAGQLLRAGRALAAGGEADGAAARSGWAWSCRLREAVLAANAAQALAAAVAQASADVAGQLIERGRARAARYALSFAQRAAVVLVAAGGGERDLSHSVGGFGLRGELDGEALRSASGSGGCAARGTAHAFVEVEGPTVQVIERRRASEVYLSCEERAGVACAVPAGGCGVLIARRRGRRLIWPRPVEFGSADPAGGDRSMCCC